jgi:hypothetical protein
VADGSLTPCSNFHKAAQPARRPNRPARSPTQQQIARLDPVGLDHQAAQVTQWISAAAINSEQNQASGNLHDERSEQDGLSASDYQISTMLGWLSLRSTHLRLCEALGVSPAKSHLMRSTRTVITKTATLKMTHISGPVMLPMRHSLS